jgi:Kdo2-lipid IVA lauroyltransferase/acyltransferase
VSRPAFRHRVQYAAMRTVIASLGAIPWRAAVAIGGRIGRLGYRPLGIRRGVVERHVAAAFPGLPAAEVLRIAREAYAHLGRASVETALLPGLDAAHVIDLVEEVTNWPLVEKAVEDGKGFIIVTGHLGNWELGGAYLAARGVPVDAIARRMVNPLFDGYLTRTRSRLGMRVIYDADAVKRTPRAFRDGRAVAFLADQGVLGLASTFVPFFGRPAKTPRGPAVFALRFGVPIFFATAVRTPSGRYRIIFEPLELAPTGDRERDVDATVARYTQALERWVRRYPEQYFWHHRRWRRQPPDTPPELREP